ncbi:MAG: hypothetical protein A3F16_00515 [Deltaproteobacteria bacterium RIFCSPHIGHO2_12_FULL_43_9]|nr:MAG: hypothetical protein A3F16_00515 [Deltaproteobacteria bacterium RIFCSPHIGHO2_12_FULL_43_9]
MAKKLPLRELLKQNSPIVSDGGMTTSLYDKGFYINRSFEELSITDPHVVRDVTQEFKRAGAKLLSTNTFNALLPKLTEYGLQEKLEEILIASVKITKDLSDNDSYVLGAIGPLGIVVEPLGPTSMNEAKAYFAKNIEIMDREGVDAISFLGFHDLNELRAAIMAAKETTEKPIFAHISVQENMKTFYGHTLNEFVRLVEEFDIDVLGCAGEVGPSGMLTSAEKLRPLTKRPISLLPNAGVPKYVNDQYIYLCNPDYIGKYAKRFIQAGVNIVGGHCGVHEKHIRAISNALRMTSSSMKSESFYAENTKSSVTIDPPLPPTPKKNRSKLGYALETGKRVFSIEVVPPKGVDLKKFHEYCEKLELGGVEFVNIPDGARAVARISSLQLASYVKQHLNLEPIPHFTARDRNLIGIQSDLLGAYVNGIRNVLLITGDPPKLGNCPGATAVYDVDSIGLTRIVSRMNQGLDLGGSRFGDPAEFLIGVALNPTTPNKKLEIDRLKYKVESGADFIMTQPIYDLSIYKSFIDESGSHNLPILMGIWPLVSLRNAEFLKNEVPGVSVPDWVLREMEKAGDSKEEAIKRGVEIAIKTMEEAKNFVAGFQVSAPFNRIDIALEVIHAIRN